MTYHPVHLVAGALVGYVLLGGLGGALLGAAGVYLYAAYVAPRCGCRR